MFWNFLYLPMLKWQFEFNQQSNDPFCLEVENSVIHGIGIINDTYVRTELKKQKMKFYYLYYNFYFSSFPYSKGPLLQTLKRSGRTITDNVTNDNFNCTPKFFSSWEQEAHT